MVIGIVSRETTPIFYGKGNDIEKFCFKEAFIKFSRKPWEKFRETSWEKVLFSGITEQNMVN